LGACSYIFFIRGTDLRFIGNKQRVGMPHRANQLDAETLYVEPGSKAIQDLDIAVIAGSGTHVEDPD
jgi:hypothetical protein